MSQDLALALAVLGDLVIALDIDSEGRNFRNEEAKQAYIGVPFRDLDPERARAILIHCDELTPYEVARLCPAVLSVAARHPEDKLLQEALSYFRGALWDDGSTDREFTSGLDAAIEDSYERHKALDRVLSSVISQNVLADEDGDVTFVLARIKHLLLNPPDDAVEQGCEMKSTDEILELASRLGIPTVLETHMLSSLEGDFGLSLLERTGYGPLDHRALGNVLSYLDERDADQLARLLPILLVSLGLQPTDEDLFNRLAYLHNPLRDDAALAIFGESLRLLYSAEQLDILNTLVSEVIARVAIMEHGVLALRELVKVKGTLCDTAFAKSLAS